MRAILLLFPLALMAQSSFITQREYASSLYKNPRGIGCDKCHGERGEGKLIARYTVVKKVKKGDKIEVVKMPKEFRAPPINALDYKTFHKALSKGVRGMPKYYLTEGEIKALYFYLKEINLERKKDDK